MTPTSVPEKLIYVVIIGPMGRGEQDAGSSPLTERLSSIAKAVVNCQERLKQQGASFTLVPISAEGIRIGDISESVWRNIDFADIAIADISTRSPNVFYELAVLHALGKPTILLDQQGHPDGIPFYLTSQVIRKVSEFSEEHLTEVLSECIPEIVNSRDFLMFWTNAITSFYTVPLVDASAASGLATGYFFNFVENIIMDEIGVLARLTNEDSGQASRLSHLVVIRPTSIENIYTIPDELSRLPSGSEVRAFSGFAPSRPLTYRVIGPYIVDYPSHLKLLTSTPSFRKIRSLMRQFPNQDQSAINKLEMRLIEAYMNTIRNLAETNHRSNPSKLKILTIDELRQELGAT